MVNMMATSNYIVAIFPVVLSLIQYSSTTTCRYPLPGVVKLTNGVDITYLDLIPLEGFSIGGFKSPVLQLTCNRGKTWVAPSGVEYDVPDQVWSKMTLAAGTNSATVDVLRSYHQVKEKMATEASISGGFGPFAFSASASYMKMQDTITNSNKEIIDVRSRESSHKIELHSPKKKGVVDPEFNDYLEYFVKGNTFKSNKDVFKDFIDMFGTHYIKSGSYGGVIRKYMETSSNYSSTKTDSELSAQALASYDGLVAKLSASAKFDKGKTKVDMSFKSATIETVTYHGGEANLMVSDGLSHWQATVDKDPVLFTIETKVIYSFIKDASLKSELKIAIDDYVMRSFIKEINRKVTNAIRKWSDPILKELLHEVQTLQKVDILIRKEVLDMDSKVEHQITPPNWFIKDTAICLKYKAMAAGHSQCNGEEANTRENRTLCAKPNRYTKNYHDNTGWGENGCSMHWGIQSFNPPHWFKDTKICFKNKKVAINKEDEYVDYCAPVNDFTGKFIDETWRRFYKTTNDMSWSIVLPKGVPLWLKHSKLCYEWEPYTKKHGGQCWADTKQVCAKAGKYTSVYQDSTNRDRYAGCLIKWGWYTVSDTSLFS